MTNPLYAASRSTTCAIVNSIWCMQCFESDFYDDIIVSALRNYQQVCNNFNDMMLAICYAIEKDNFDITVQPRNSMMLWLFGIRTVA